MVDNAAFGLNNSSFVVEEENPFLEDAKGIGGLVETAVSMGTGYGALIYSGGRGIVELLATGDFNKAADLIDKIQAEYTYQPRTEKGKAITGKLGEIVESGLDLAQEGGEAAAPEGSELGGGIVGRATAETALALLPFLPKTLRSLKSAKQARTANQVAVKAQQALVAEAKKKAGPGLKERVSRVADEMQGIPVKEAKPASPAPTAPIPELVQRPRSTWLGDAIDSPYLRAEQQFPNTSIPMELRRMEATRIEKMAQHDPLVIELARIEKKVKNPQKFKETWLAQDKAKLKEMSEAAIGKKASEKFWADYEASVGTRYTEMRGAGLKIDELPEYLPRLVVDHKKFLKHSPPKLQAKVMKLDKQLLEGIITEAEYAAKLNSEITAGGAPFVVRPTSRHAKERMSYRAHKDMYDAYAGPTQTLRNYFNETGSAITERHFLGLGDDISKSIGAKVASEKKAGRLTDVQAEQYRKILEARFGPKSQIGPDRMFAVAKDFGYAGTIAQMGSAVTQLGDIMPAIARHGIGSAGKAIGRSVLPRKARKRMKTVEPTDLGYGDIMQEMIGSPSKMKNILDKLLRVSGFKMVDRFGKRVYLNAAMDNYSRMARTPKGVKKLEAKGYKRVLGDEFDQFVVDLKTRNMENPNVRYALVNELAEVQPIFMSDMPIMYLKHPNGRIVYSLKTWAIRQLNRMREDVMNKKYADAGKYALAVYVGTNSIDLAKKFLESMVTKEDLTPEDINNMALNNMLQMIMTNRYQVSKAGTQDSWDTVMAHVEPPAFGIMDDIFHDIRTWNSEEAKVRSVSRIPVVGRTLEPIVNQ